MTKLLSRDDFNGQLSKLSELTGYTGAANALADHDMELRRLAWRLLQASEAIAGDIPASAPDRVCHVGICSEAECRRCSAARIFHEAIKDARAGGVE